MRGALAHPHEGRARVVLLERAARLGVVERARQARLHGDVDAARERARVRHEGELGLDAGRGARAGDDLGRMAMGQRVVAVEVAVPEGMMCALDGLAARAGAARDAAHEQGRLDDSKREEGHRGEQYRGGEAARMADVRSLEAREMLGQRAGELGEARGGRVRLAVDLFIGSGGGVTEVGGDIDDPHFVAAGGRGAQHPVDEPGGGTVRRRGEHRRRRPLRELAGHLGERREARLGVGRDQVRKRARHGLAGRAVGHHGEELEVRVARDQAQQLTRHVARAAQDDRRRPRAARELARRTHAAAAAWSPSASITRSPSAAALEIALKAGTPIWPVMISTPT